MINLTTAQQASISAEVITLCTCWDMYRSDGTVFQITDHDAAVTVNGNIYSPVAALTASASHKESGLKARNKEFSGAIEIGVVTDADLAAGKYTNQMIREYVVDYTSPGNGPIYTNLFWINSVEFTGEVWNVQVIGVSGWLKRQYGFNYDRICRFNLGDSNCNYNLQAAGVNATVASITDNRLAFTPSTGTNQADGYYNDGVLTWTSGANSGVQSEIQLYQTGALQLWLRTPAPIAVGDAFTYYPGCDRLMETCINKFNNFIRFGGFPYIPGTDRMFSTPT